MWQNHPKSTWADDALFEEAQAARAAGDEAGACDAASVLVQQLPESRFAPCARLLCGSVAAGSRPCHDYVKRGAGLQ